LMVSPMVKTGDVDHGPIPATWAGSAVVWAVALDRPDMTSATLIAKRLRINFILQFSVVFGESFQKGDDN
jgi:hypothetical protein